ncbi:hypothetical protein FRC03_002147 [Tulasnella sp. 419]|nr:hypothetical protein FRC03_002147 [Tulasnella sp. 419]
MGVIHIIPSLVWFGFGLVAFWCSIETLLSMMSLRLIAVFWLISIATGCFVSPGFAISPSSCCCLRLVLGSQMFSDPLFNVISLCPTSLLPGHDGPPKKSLAKSLFRITV